MVMTHSLLQLLVQKRSPVIIDVLAPAWCRPLVERMPEVRRIWLSPFQHKALDLYKRYQLGRQLRKEKYDQAIIIPNSLKSALVPFWANIPVCTGWIKEWPRHWFVNDSRILDKNRLPMMVQRFAALGLDAQEELPAEIPKPVLRVSVEDRNEVLAQLQLSTPVEPLLILAPGAEYGSAKRWPASYFAEVARAKLDQGWSVWLLGSPNDQAVAEEIHRLCQRRTVNLVGKTNLLSAVDLLSLSTIFVGNDSGLLHIAAALQIPIVGIYGPTDPQLAPPLTDKSVVMYLGLSCSPCAQRVCPLGHWRCMLDIAPSEVLAQMDRLLCS